MQRCASGELVVIHDQDLGRTTNGVGLVSDITYDEIHRLSAGQWFDIGYRSEKVPLLSEVLDMVAGKSILSNATMKKRSEVKRRFSRKEG